MCSKPRRATVTSWCAPASGKGRRILFTRTKFQTQKLAKDLTQNGIPAAELHGNLSQNQRDRNLAAFNSGDVNVMVATDVAREASTFPVWNSWCRSNRRKIRNPSCIVPDEPREPAIPVTW